MSREQRTLAYGGVAVAAGILFLSALPYLLDQLFFGPPACVPALGPCPPGQGAS